MTGCAAEHHAHKVGLGETGDTALTGRGRTQGVGNVLHGGGAGNPNVRVGDVGPFGGNRKEGGRDTHWVPSEYHEEVSAAGRIRDVGDARGGRSTVGIRNAVGDDLHRDTAGKRGTVGGATSPI